MTESQEILKNLSEGLTPIQQKFVLHWGEMGARWGINRTVAQVHALLFISSRPLNADEIVELLTVARSNVSTSLKELQGWGIVKLVHIVGDKRDHFESLKDVWEMFRIVTDERKKREFDPTMRLLRECLSEAERGKSTDAYTQDRLRDLCEFFETTTGWYATVRGWPTATLLKFMKASNRTMKLLGLGSGKPGGHQS